MQSADCVMMEQSAALEIWTFCFYCSKVRVCAANITLIEHEPHTMQMSLCL